MTAEAFDWRRVGKSGLAGVALGVVAVVPLMLLGVGRLGSDGGSRYSNTIGDFALEVWFVVFIPGALLMGGGAVVASLIARDATGVTSAVVVNVGYWLAFFGALLAYLRSV